MTDTPNTPELNPQDVQDEDDLDVVVMTDEDGTEYLYDRLVVFRGSIDTGVKTA